MVIDMNGVNGFAITPNTGGILMPEKTYQTIIWLIFLSVLIFSPSISSGQQLQLNIHLSDTSYFIDQSIWLDVGLTNIIADTMRTLQFKFPGGDVLNIILTNEEGDTLKPALLFEFLDWSGFILNPKETYYETFDLADIFHITPGKYEVSARYNYRHNRLDTPNINFEVTKPTGAEQQALQLYTEAFKNQNRENYFPSKQLLSKLITSYPKSVYAEKVYSWLNRDTDLLEKCPDSGYHQGYLRTAVNKMSKEEKKKFLEKVIKDHPGTRSAKFAQQMLRGW